MALFRFRTFTIEKIDSIASRLKYVSQTHPPFENPPGGGGGRGGGGSEVGLHLRWVNEVTYLSFVTILWAQWPVRVRFTLNTPSEF